MAEHLLSRRTLRALETFEPFGEGNKRPRFVIKNVPLMDARPVGKTGEHIKCTLVANDEPLDGIGFGLADRLAGLARTQQVDVLGELEENEFRGQRRLQINIRDITPAGEVSIAEE